MNMNFIDTDLLIQHQAGEKLQNIINSKGLKYFLEIENNILKSLHLTNTVIATGGSAVYSQAGMKNLKQNGIIIFIDTPLEELKRRVTNMKSRGIACDPGMSYDELYQQRINLYRQICDITVSGKDNILENTVYEIIEKLTIKE
ncbi:Shikimate kinase [bioreactor metagenome]|uniref:Shikimate kinase n=1 Tax=bioreactor metagenome TaxID=1076179 RepID=A0A645GLF2_9ZZZZ